ncbi:hypothetical protein [Streptomyces violaceusniger]|uniref:Uncharacterized protein n=1 Tax=Streptomyces violaceusniger (strain Tu 4113) TaxID=653045 RepID=G2NZQ5_STRV4|nr:hypothetical protein [Streptomyces violaceusniger]AEM83678.1 hypothetical protein Strvi_4020 [Streptomyces violaceusniger Tu 4113]
MNDRFIPPIQALPDGDAEVRLVLHLPWEVVAALGQEAGRLAAQSQRPVSLDEAVSHRLRQGTHTIGVHAKPERERPQPAATAPHPAPPLAARSPGEQARQAIEKINGSAQPHNGTANGGAGAAESTGPQHTTGAPEPAPPDARGILERPTRATGTVNGTSTEMPR